MMAFAPVASDTRATATFFCETYKIFIFVLAMGLVDFVDLMDLMNTNFSHYSCTDEFCYELLIIYFSSFV